MIWDEEVWEMMLAREARCGCTNNAAAKDLMVIGCVFVASIADSETFDKARRAARTTCGGLLEGQIFDRIAGSAEASCNGVRKAGPPSLH